MRKFPFLRAARSSESASPEHRLLSAEILKPLSLRERVRRAMDFVLRQGKILPVEGVYIVVLDRHRAIF